MRKKKHQTARQPVDEVRVATKVCIGNIVGLMVEIFSWKWKSRSPDAARAIAATSVHERLIFIRGVARARLLLHLPRGPLGAPPPRCRFSPPPSSPPLSPSQPPHRRSSSHVAAELRRARTNLDLDPSEDQLSSAVRSARWKRSDRPESSRLARSHLHRACQMHRPRRSVGGTWSLPRNDVPVRW